MSLPRQKGTFASRESPSRGSPRERQRSGSVRRKTPELPPRTGSQSSSRLGPGPARASSGSASSSNDLPSHSVGHIGKARPADTSSTPLSLPYSFLPPGHHAELLVVSYPCLDDVLYAYEDPVPLMHLKIPLHAQVPGDCSLILQVGPKRRRVFTFGGSQSVVPLAGGVCGGLDMTRSRETLVKSVVSRQVYRECIDQVERIVRRFKGKDEMSSQQWAIAIMDACEKEGCFVKMPQEEKRRDE